MDYEENEIPGSNTYVEVSNKQNLELIHRNFLKKANLLNLSDVESWTVIGSNSAINYSTHGIFRYYGKFPAPIARKLIEDYGKAGLILDPACGSGTTGVESLLLGNEAILTDINPLSVLISKVKTTHISGIRMSNALDRVIDRKESIKTERFVTSEIDLNHWFLPKTVRELNKIRTSIDFEKEKDLRFYLLESFAAIIRRVSKATTQQGRLFLDIETAIENPQEIFIKNSIKTAKKISELPNREIVTVKQQNLLNKLELDVKTDLVIYHPPYFNSYKYSSINSLELAWLSQNRKDIRHQEIREFFKVGKPENAEHYVNDLTQTVMNISHIMKKNSFLAIMIGDALLKGKHIPVTRKIIDNVKDCLTVEKVILRVPKHTEASWATSQRRSKSSLGITMYDFILILRKS